MREAMASRWPVWALRGALAVLFGVLAIAWPGPTLLALVLMFGVYALADGILAGVMAFAPQPPQPRWLLGLEAALGLLVGVAALTRPGLTAATMLVTLGLWAVIAGGLRIVQAITLRKQIRNEWLLGASGALAIVLGLIVLNQPTAGALALVWLIGALAIGVGAAEIGLAMKLRSRAAAPEAGMRLWTMRAEEHPEAVRDKVER